MRGLRELSLGRWGEEELAFILRSEPSFPKWEVLHFTMDISPEGEELPERYHTVFKIREGTYGLQRLKRIRLWHCYEKSDAAQFTKFAEEVEWIHERAKDAVLHSFRVIG